MRRSTSKVAPKRAIHIYEDEENQECKKMKTVEPLRKVGGEGNQTRKPLADLLPRNSSVAAKNNITNKTSKGVLKEVNHSLEPQKEKTQQGKTNENFIESIQKTTAKNDEVQCTQSEQCLPEALEKRLQKKDRIREKNQIVFSVPYYLKNIYSYLFTLEDKFFIPQDHLEGHAFTGPMRAVLIDWLAGLMDHMDLLQETLQLTVYVIDKYMSIVTKTTKASAQLVGLSALYVAAKYEETEVIELTDLTIVCAHAWTETDIKAKEREILETIGYQLGRPLAIHFIRRLTKISGASPMEHCYAKFFADTSLLSYQLCHVKPSKIAAASVFLGMCVSRNRIDPTFWTSELTESSGYKLDELQPTLKLIARTVTGADAGKLQGIQSRYSCSQLYCVSIMPGCRAGGIINSF